MFPAVRSDAAPAVHTIASTVLGRQLVLTRFVGRATHALSEAAHLEFHKLVADVQQPVWLSDATRLTGFEARSLALGPRWFATFRERGGRDCLVISSWDRAMMAARTMALGLGVRIQNFATLEQAKAAAALILHQDAR
jgi:hypothetical protein